MPSAPALLTLLALGSGFVAALLAANLMTAGHARIAKRRALLEAVRLKREAHHRRVERALAAFDSAFDDIEIEFDPVPILTPRPRVSGGGRG
ncbi:hypothetical protein [Phycisphaera mikurensis]|uniref:Uncharacterized protein n=1 Tax=Phycisphaera mikurensis (strain NBRC 102666 / KCTC 22515 / FYK2301M01) TaxID=1142394 RepID=I0IEG9_PHYMF|nr:hypothetical protein [Phycisphaera mikurensis]MBB6441456.1 hypothetical protein [Phycisphaera mikurensis]BAM03657.1 hypothetical protein PSMK_14980 [Phycisphaera mikurensis NBRC 102666]